MELGRVLIEDVHRRVVKGYPAQVRASLEALRDEQVWWRPTPRATRWGTWSSTPAGPPATSWAGAWGGARTRGTGPREFAEKGLPRQELLAVLEETVAEAERVLDALDPARLLEGTDRVGEPQTALAILLRTAHH